MDRTKHPKYAQPGVKVQRRKDGATFEIIRMDKHSVTVAGTDPDWSVTTLGGFTRQGMYIERTMPNLSQYRKAEATDGQ